LDDTGRSVTAAVFRSASVIDGPCGVTPVSAQHEGHRQFGHEGTVVRVTHPRMVQSGKHLVQRDGIIAAELGNGAAELIGLVWRRQVEHQAVVA
jgi:hypothetical protein